MAKQLMKLMEQRGRRLGVRVFLDERNIQAGKSIPETIGEHLQICKEFVVLLSRYSLASEWVKYEIGGAYFQPKRPVMVAILDKLEPNELPDPLVSYKAIDLNDFDKYLVELIDRVRRDLHGKKRRTKR